MEGNQTIRVFLDTNILISGIFFSGIESKLLSLSKIEFITSDTAVSELKEVVMRKFVSIKAESNMEKLGAVGLLKNLKVLLNVILTLNEVKGKNLI